MEGINRLKETDPTCITDTCAVIEINYPIFKNQSLLNQRIEVIIKNEIEGFIPSAGNAKTISDYMHLFIDSYVVFKNQFPESKTPWFLKIKLETNYNDSEWLSFVSSSESYTGGVRTSESLRYLNTDTLGRTIDLEKKIGDFGKLREQAEIIFRNQNKISSRSRLSSAGYTFRNNQFHLPENIGRDETHILLLYNSYEIGNSIQGEIVVKIPFCSQGEGGLPPPPLPPGVIFRPFEWG